MIHPDWKDILAADPKLAIEMQRDFAARACKAQGSLTAVSQSGINQSQGYRYTRAADMLTSVSHVLHENGLYVMDVKTEVVSIDGQTTKSGSVWQRIVTKVTAEVGDGIFYFRGSALGGGSDPGDKAPYKCNTGGLKYAVCAALLVAMGEDPEAAKQAEEASRPTDPALVWFGPHTGKPIAKASLEGAKAYYEIAAKHGATPEHFEHITARIAELEKSES